MVLTLSPLNPPTSPYPDVEEGFSLSSECVYLSLHSYLCWMCTGPCLSMVAYTFSERKCIVLSQIIRRSFLVVLSASTARKKKTASEINHKKLHLIERRSKDLKERKKKGTNVKLRVEKKKNERTNRWEWGNFKSKETASQDQIVEAIPGKFKVGLNVQRFP